MLGWISGLALGIWNVGFWLLCLAGILAGGYLLLWLVWKLPSRATQKVLLNSDKERAELQDAYRKTIVQTIGGLAFFATFAFTIYQFTAQQEQASRQHANTIFIDAIKTFSDQNATNNAGALYTLQKVAEQRSEFISPVVNTIAFFVRRQPEPKSKVWTTGETATRIEKTPSPTDVQAAISILTALNKDGRHPPDLRNATVHSARFSENDDCGSNNHNPKESESAKGFQGANFQAALIYGSRFCNINLSNAAFDGAWGNYNYAYGEHLTKDQWNTKPFNDIRHLFIVSFFNSNLTKAGFDNAHFAGADFSKSRLAGARFENADLTIANFTDAILADTTWYSREDVKAHFYRAILVDADFTRVDLEGVSFEAANITGADFSNAINAEKAKFADACEDSPAKFKNAEVRAAAIKHSKRCNP